MGPFARRLPSRGPAGKAIGEVAGGEAGFNAPSGSDGCEWLEDEVALADLRMRNGEPSRAELAAAPYR